MTVRSKSYFLTLSPKDLVHQLMTNTSEADPIRRAVRDLMDRDGHVYLYDWIRSRPDEGRQQPAAGEVNPQRVNGPLTGAAVARMKTTKEVALACVQTGFDATNYPRLRNPHGMNYSVIAAAESEGDGEVIESMQEGGRGLWKTIQAALAQHIDTIRRTNAQRS